MARMFSEAFLLTAYAAAHPIEAAHERRREEQLYNTTIVLKSVLGVPLADAQAAVGKLCAEFGLTMEGLRVRLLRGDVDVWQAAQRQSAIDASAG